MSGNTAVFAPLKGVLCSDFHPQSAGRMGKQGGIVLVMFIRHLPSKVPVASLGFVAEAAQPVPRAPRVQCLLRALQPIAQEASGTERMA